MKSCFKIFRNLYQDSVSLMQIAARLGKLAGIEQAAVVMGTETNRRQLDDAGLGEGIDAGPNDLVIAVRGDDEACAAALAAAQECLSAGAKDDQGAGHSVQLIPSLEMALEQEPAASMALISVPGDYAAAETIKALRLGMNVMLFSDNVSLEHERAIKTLAKERQLMVMGPDCGTAIINGLPLGFANVVRRGAIGLVAASGTGLQEVTCRIDQLGAGVSQALGTGGHDLHEDIGGTSMLTGLDALIQDPDTRVIVLISKPPARSVAKEILARASTCGKPVVVNFLGAPASELDAPGITAAFTLADAAELAVALLNGQALPSSVAQVRKHHAQMLVKHCEALEPGRRFIRGVFAGGTFCYENQLLCLKQGFVGSSNTPVKGNHVLENIWHSVGHTVVDMGDDLFTRGRPHPMIDPTLRNERILAELRDPETAVVVFDMVLGYGAAEQPAKELVDLLAQAKAEAASDNFPLLISHVCGTESDPQQRSRQIDALQSAGVLIAGCNAQAALWASYVADVQAGK